MNLQDQLKMVERAMRANEEAQLGSASARQVACERQNEELLTLLRAIVLTLMPVAKD
jgi:hypothetical protein